MKYRHILFCALILLGGCSTTTEQDVTPVVNVKVAAAEEADIQLTVEVPATVFPREQANIAARVTSPIRELNVRKGDSVTKDQVLARLENRDLLAQRREAAAAVTDAEAMLAKITAGTLPGDIERARGQVETTRAALDQAQKFYERRKQLFEQGAIPNRDLVVSETELAQARTAYEVARRSLDLLEQQSGERDIQIAQSRLEQAGARLALIEAQMAFTEVRAPFSGAVIEQFAYPGDMAKPDSPIFTVADLSIVIVRAQAPETDAHAIRSGAACSLTPSDEPGMVYPGRITVINSAVDPARRTVEVWCEIPNRGRRLRTGVFGALRIVTGAMPNAVVVPLSAVQFEEGARKGFVMVVGADGKAAKKDVETGPSTGNVVPIRSGVMKGEMVIVEGGYGLPEGTEVKASEAEKK